MPPKNSSKPVYKKPSAEKKSKITDQNANDIEFSPQVQKIYKIILRTMSWVVGLSILLVIGLFYFNSPLIDRISQIIFYTGFITLLMFIIIELVSIKVKILLSKLINGRQDAQNIDRR